MSTPQGLKTTLELFACVKRYCLDCLNRKGVHFPQCFPGVKGYGSEADGHLDT